ncbi:thioredoxin family protein [Curtobacterium sp. 458]|uniref:TlpA family protein disulfide reductase n=1 Tax=Curtobacterium sp. 458 TaxID=3050069 RepID=UPI0025B30A63|nr:thioredoxin family protein [Curtobacterium sp. 458]WJX99855.1 thioredoxin family protein [Curtobacterium sp. 458]
MTVVTAVAVLVGVLAVATVLGLVLRSRTGRAWSVRGTGADTTNSSSSSNTAHGIAPAEAFGTRATLVQFSTPTCARCPGTRRQLDALAGQHDGVARLEIDVAERTEVASRYNVLQTPTVLLVDADRAVRTRFGGPPRPAELSAALTAVLQEAPA